jgi:DNA polymerase-3 subunit alpha (Gram-positive type)
MDRGRESLAEFPFVRALDKSYQKLLSGWLLQKVIVYKRSRKLDIYVKAPRYVETEKIFIVENAIKKNLTGIDQVRLRINFPDEFDDLAGRLSECWKDIAKSLKRDMPACGRWINLCTPTLKNEELQIKVQNPAVLDLLNSRKTDGYIQNWIFVAFNRNVKVKFILDSDAIDDQKEKYHSMKNHENSNLIKAAVKEMNNTGTTNGRKGKQKSRSHKDILMGRAFGGDPVALADLGEDSGNVVVEGKVFDIEKREIKGGKVIYCMDITDYSSSITVKSFCDNEKAKALDSSLSKGDWVRVRGECQYDKYQKEIVIFFNAVMMVDYPERMDEAEKKRVELHLHTQMSAMDGVASVSDLVSRAAKWGHPAIAITDHGVLQAFPDAYAAGKKNGIKIIYGVEAYLINDCKPLILNANKMDFDQTFVVLDLETTGLNSKNDAITEIGAVKVKNKQVVEYFQTFVNPQMAIPTKITELTGITNEMVKDAPEIETVLEQFRDFCKDSSLVAHNAPFDLGFLKEKAKRINWKIKNPIVDTLTLSRELLPKLKRHKLNLVAKHLGVQLHRHHRAKDDAQATAGILVKLLEILEDKNVKVLEDINTAFVHTTNINSLENNHATILVKNETGLRNLYILASKSHIDYFYRKPRIPKSILMQMREGLLIGSGCEAGELYKAMVKGTPYQEIQEIVKFYDFLEIQPNGNNEYLIREGYLKSEAELNKINKKIVELGDRFGKPVVATGDVHFLEPQDEYFRRVLMSGQGFSDADHQPPHGILHINQPHSQSGENLHIPQ